ncbi:MAG: radical SAM protein [Firmicutes bacterium]|nr:radical SAM protein [Bacillota bacterium]
MNKENQTRSLLDFSQQELEQMFVNDFALPAFRARQIYSWLLKGVDIDGINNIPKDIKQQVNAHLAKNKMVALPLKIVKALTSKTDGTIKFLYATADNNIIEGVLLRYKHGNTLCVSTQVGCNMGCVFCASSIDGLVRNLSAGEILGQLVVVENYLNNLNHQSKNDSTIVNNINGGHNTTFLDKPISTHSKKDNSRAITNIVLMGSGEPLDNYDNVVKFLKMANSKDGLNISYRNISLSTCGVASKIRQLADDKIPLTLSISLHSASQEKRQLIMPIAKKYPLDQLISACKYYFNSTKRRIVLEFSLIDTYNGIKNFNTTKEEADKLFKIFKGFPYHVNIIPLNHVPERAVKPALEHTAKTFLNYLQKNNISATIRRTLGADIGGACGQLRRQSLDDNI